MNDNNGQFLREEYISRINRVQDHIEGNISEEFSLSELSQIANFSPFHFHRIFSAMTGETLFQFIQRIRLEKAAFLLVTDRRAEITQIALECGFSNQASFAKAFKAYFGITASGYRREGIRQKSIDADSNMGKVSDKIECYNGNVVNRQCPTTERPSDLPFSVQIKELPPLKVVYIRNTGPYKNDAELFQRLFGKLYTWAAGKGLHHSAGSKWLTLFHQKLDLADDDKIRISVCMIVEENVKVDGEVGKLVIPGGKYAVGRFCLNTDQYQAAWDTMAAKWLPESGFQPDDRLCFELYPGDLQGDQDNQVVDICIPVKHM